MLSIESARVKRVNDLQSNIIIDKRSQLKLKNNKIRLCIQFKFPSGLESSR